MVFTVVATQSSEPPEVQKAAVKAREQLIKLGIDGEVAFALRLDQDRGSFAFGVPNSLVFPDPAKVKSIIDLTEMIEEAREAAWAKSTSASASN